MSDIFATYQPPGIYIEEQLPNTVPVFTVDSTVVAIVGPSIGYRRYAEAVTLTSTDPVTLTKLGIDTDSVVVTKANGDTAVVDDDYTLTESTGEDNDADTLDDTLSIERSGGTTITSGETVVVTYNYTDPTFYDPVRATAMEQVIDAFGQPLDATTGEIISPLSFAAQMAFTNGATRLVLLSTDGSASQETKANLSDGYDILSAQEDVNIIVPLPVGITGTDNSPGDVITLTGELATKMDADGADGTYRTAILGYDLGVTISPTDLAEGAASKRVMVVYPTKMDYYNAVLGRNVVISGYYLAAAYAGRMSALPPQVPITRKSLRGFAGIPTTVLSSMTRATKDAWSSGGVAVTELSRQKGLVCRHGTSTDPSSIYTREISIVRARDAMLSSIFRTLDQADLIGSAIVEETPARIQAIIQGVLESVVQKDLIVAYGQISVRQVSLDPTVIEVKFSYQPAYPLNYIQIVFSIDTNTGSVALTPAA